MSKQHFHQTLQQELERIDAAKISKRFEKVIEGFSADANPHALVAGKEYRIFNSNDYLGLRHHPKLKHAEYEASEKFGAGPGAVRFISGTLKVHRDLEQAIARFHDRQEAMVFSSAFAANLGALFCLIKGQSRDSLVSGNTLVISDELNHRSIIDGIRLPNLDSMQKAIFPHMQPAALASVLEENVGKFDRVIVVTDGVFSMLGEIQNLSVLREIVDQYDDKFAEGVWLVVDDCHGVAACGVTGRGTEEVTGARADVLIGTFGKGFGADGGYVVADKIVIDYLRESAATYIYSNSISPATAGAALAAVQVVDSEEGQQLLATLSSHVQYFKKHMREAGFTFAADSQHPIQPLLIADPDKTKALTDALFAAGIIATNINFPVVPKGKDEIRVQLSATHTTDDLDQFISTATHQAQEVGVIES